MILRIAIKKNKQTLVRIDSFTIRDNHINFLFGESGIGKTMMARATFGLLESDEFDIQINDESYSTYQSNDLYQAIRTHGFFVFQEPSSHLNPLLTLRDQIREGSLAHAVSEQEIIEHLWPEENHRNLNRIIDIYPRPFRPSGGEKQRILMTMAFKKIDLYLQRSDSPLTLFIFDEPTGNLDNTHRNVFLQYLIEKYRQRNFTILFITHDYSISAELVDKYPDLMERICFTDLLLTAGGLKQEIFSAQRYLDWSKHIKPISSLPDRAALPLLKVENPITIFDWDLIISKDAQGKNLAALEVYPGEMVYLKAGSGVGKTTLAKGVMGLLQTRQLQLRIDGLTFSEKTDLARWRREIWGRKATMVFQHADEALNLNARVKDVFSGLPSGVKRNEQYLLQQLQWIFNSPIGLDFLNQKVGTLSGGQKQRLNLLRSFILDTDLIILDEPLNGLGFDSIQKVIELMQEKQENRKGILLISHNEDIFDRLIPLPSIYYLQTRISKTTILI